jgi:hypothetical protein
MPLATGSQDTRKQYPATKPGTTKTVKFTKDYLFGSRGGNYVRDFKLDQVVDDLSYEDIQKCIDADACVEIKAGKGPKE